MTSPYMSRKAYLSGLSRLVIKAFTARLKPCPSSRASSHLAKALTTRVSVARLKAVKFRDTAKPKPCPSLTVFPSLLRAVMASCGRQIGQLKNLIWTCLKFSRPFGAKLVNSGSQRRSLRPSLVWKNVRTKRTMQTNSLSADFGCPVGNVGD
jgi:hypothetical protein